MSTISYKAALLYPSIAGSFVPSLLGRLSLAVSGLALILHIERETSSFALAGLVTALFGIANVVATPIRARAIDQFGQFRPLLLLGITHAAALVALAFVPLNSAAVPAIFAIAAGVTSPPFGAVMRVIWSHTLPKGPMRTRGLSLDAVSEELMFTVGPLAAAVLASAIQPVAALLLSASLVAGGTVLFVASPRSRSERGHRNDVSAAGPSGPSPLRTPFFFPVVIAMLVPGILLGAVEIAAPALGLQAASTVLAGILLACFAASSAIAGLLYGRLNLRGSQGGRLLVLTTAAVIIAALGGLLGSVFAVFIGITLTGALIAPLLIAAYSAADELTDPRVHTEANSWINTAVNLGAAAGSALYGILVDRFSPGMTLAACAVVAATVLAATFLRLRRVP